MEQRENCPRKKTKTTKPIKSDSNKISTVVVKKTVVKDQQAECRKMRKVMLSFKLKSQMCSIDLRVHHENLLERRKVGDFNYNHREILVHDIQIDRRLKFLFSSFAFLIT